MECESPATSSKEENGRDYEACRGGDCQIEVSKPVKIPLSNLPGGVDDGPLTVRRVNAAGVEVRLVTPAGPELRTTIKKGCTTTFYANNAEGAALTRCSGKEPEDILGMYIKQMVTVEDITGGTAILTLESA